MKRGETRRIGRYEIIRCDSPRDTPTGPMGGWWAWKLGLIGGGNTVIVELVYYQFRITRHAK